VDAVGLIKGFPLRAVDGNSIGWSEELLEVFELDVYRLDLLTFPVSDIRHYRLLGRLDLGDRVGFIIPDVHVSVIDPGYYRRTCQELDVLGVAVVSQRFEFQGLGVPLLLRLPFHHSCVHLFPLAVGEADMHTGEGIVEIVFPEVGYVAGGRQVEVFSIRPPTSAQLDAVSITKVMQGVRLFVVTRLGHTILHW